MQFLKLCCGSKTNCSHLGCEKPPVFLKTENHIHDLNLKKAFEWVMVAKLPKGDNQAIGLEFFYGTDGDTQVMTQEVWDDIQQHISSSPPDSQFTSVPSKIKHYIFTASDLMELRKKLKCENEIVIVSAIVNDANVKDWLIKKANAPVELSCPKLTRKTKHTKSADGQYCMEWVFYTRMTAELVDDKVASTKDPSATPDGKVLINMHNCLMQVCVSDAHTQAPRCTVSITDQNIIIQHIDSKLVKEGTIDSYKHNQLHDIFIKGSRKMTSQNTDVIGQIKEITDAIDMHEISDQPHSGIVCLLQDDDSKCTIQRASMLTEPVKLKLDEHQKQWGCTIGNGKVVTDTPGSLCKHSDFVTVAVSSADDATLTTLRIE